MMQLLISNPQPFPEFDLPLVAEASAGPTFGKMEELED